MYEKIEYPKWKYHEELDPRLVKSKDEDEALGDEWKEVPFEYEEVIEETTEKPVRRRKKKE